VLTANNAGNYAAAHAYACISPDGTSASCTPDNFTGGFAANTAVTGAPPPAPIPEPSATLLFGMGSLLAGAAIRRRS